MAALQALSGLGKVFQGISMTNQGAAAAKAGAEFNATLYDMAATTSIDVAEYNQEIEKRNLDRSMDALSREITALFGRNRAAWSGSGFSLASKSFLATTNTSMSNLERVIDQRRSSSKQKMKEIMFEGQVEQVNNLNRAKAARFEGEMAQYRAASANAKSIGGAIQNTFSSFLG